MRMNERGGERGVDCPFGAFALGESSSIKNEGDRLHACM